MLLIKIVKLQRILHSCTIYFSFQVMDSFYQYVICIWSVSATDYPDYVLKCPNQVTSFCTIFKSTIGFVTAAHVDG